MQPAPVRREEEERNRREELRRLQEQLVREREERERNEDDARRREEAREREKGIVMSGVQDTAQEGGGKEHLAFIALPTNYEQNAEVNSGQIASADPFQSNDGSFIFYNPSPQSILFLSFQSLRSYQFANLVGGLLHLFAGSSAFGAKQFLNSKGLGWLLEHEETDEDPDSQLPLLYPLPLLRGTHCAAW